jgi:hypothetical protein
VIGKTEASPVGTARRLHGTKFGRMRARTDTGLNNLT